MMNRMKWQETFAMDTMVDAEEIEESIVALNEKGSTWDALRKLFDNQEKTAKIIDKEIPFFQFYVNLAITNIQETAKLDDHIFDPVRIVEELGKKYRNTNECKHVEQLANFLWLFKSKEPQSDYREDGWEEYCYAIVKRLYELRGFFCHQNENRIGALIIRKDEEEFAQFFLSDICDKAREYAVGRSCKSEKLYKLKTLNMQGSHYVDDRGKVVPKEVAEGEPGYKRITDSWYFTRKGIIMLICMGLYKDEAIEFLSCLHDLQLKEEIQRRGLVDFDFYESTEERMRKKRGSIQCLHDFFTCYSIRRSNNAVDPREKDFACYTDIIADLNKVPEVAWDNLALSDECQKMQELYEKSNEKDENSVSRYRLHKREKDRTLSMLAAYCEDFELFPIHFKRLDVTPNIGRSQYRYGVDNSTDVRQNRHFAIKDDAIRFEWRPKEHYGDIKINALRSAISCAELRRLIIASKRFSAKKWLDDYFTAYHRILERMLAEDLNSSYIDRTSYLDDLCTISLATKGELTGDNQLFLEKLRPYFPENLIRFFIPQDSIPTDKQLRENLRMELNRLIEADKQFLDEASKRRELRRKMDDPDIDAKKELRKLPKTNDGMHIRKVFQLMNLYLKPEDKFRQLPRGERHHDNNKKPAPHEKRPIQDTDFQEMHRIIGKFATDSDIFWDRVKGQRTLYCWENFGGKPKRRKCGVIAHPDNKCRSSLRPMAVELKKEYNAVHGEEENYLFMHPRLDANGNEIKARPSLEKLAEAAVRCHLSYCQQRLVKLDAQEFKDRDLLEAECRKFGLRIGMALDRESLLKTVLRLDLNKWQHAFNYEARKNYGGNRCLENDRGHVVSQVPLNNSFTEQRCIRDKHNGVKDLFKGADDKGNTPHFLFGKVLREQMFTGVALRDFYNAEPMYHFYKEGACQETLWDDSLKKMPQVDNPEQLQEELKKCPFQRFYSKNDMPSRKEMSVRMKKLHDVEHADLLLLYVAMEYYKRWNNTAEAGGEKKTDKKGWEGTSVYEFFAERITESMNNKDKLELRPIERTRNLFVRIKAHWSDLAAAMRKDGMQGDTFDYHQVAMKLREIESADRDKKIKLQKMFYDLENMVLLPEPSEYDRIGQECKDEEEKKVKIRDLEYPCYLRKIGGKNERNRAKKFPKESLDELVELRNMVFHGGFNISQEKVDSGMLILKCFGIKPQD